MNMGNEGAGHDLLRHLTQPWIVPRVKNIKVRFHDFAPDTERRMRAIQADLAHTHELTYQHPFAWENWKLKGQF